jgi:hypothetical protein
MIHSVQAVDRATGDVVAALHCAIPRSDLNTTAWRLAKRVKKTFVHAGALTPAQAACVLFRLAA